MPPEFIKKKNHTPYMCKSHTDLFTGCTLPLVSYTHFRIINGTESGLLQPFAEVRIFKIHEVPWINSIRINILLKRVYATRITSTASRNLSRLKCAYRLVVRISACPNNSCTSYKLRPAFTRKLAKLCRRS